MEIFSNEQRLELRKMLESDTFRRARERIIDMTDVESPNLPAQEFALQMAIEKGVRRAFKELAKLTNPILEKPQVENPIRRGPHSPRNK